MNKIISKQRKSLELINKNRFSKWIFGSVAYNASFHTEGPLFSLIKL